MATQSASISVGSKRTRSQVIEEELGTKLHGLVDTFVTDEQRWSEARLTQLLNDIKLHVQQSAKEIGESAEKSPSTTASPAESKSASPAKEVFPAESMAMGDGPDELPDFSAFGGDVSDSDLYSDTSRPAFSGSAELLISDSITLEPPAKRQKVDHPSPSSAKGSGHTGESAAPGPPPPVVVPSPIPEPPEDSASSAKPTLVTSGSQMSLTSLKDASPSPPAVSPSSAFDSDSAMGTSTFDSKRSYPEYRVNPEEAWKPEPLPEPIRLWRQRIVLKDPANPPIIYRRMAPVEAGAKGTWIEDHDKMKDAGKIMEVIMDGEQMVLLKDPDSGDTIKLGPDKCERKKPNEPWELQCEGRFERYYAVQADKATNHSRKKDTQWWHLLQMIRNLNIFNRSWRGYAQSVRTLLKKMTQLPNKDPVRAPSMWSTEDIMKAQMVVNSQLVKDRTKRLEKAAAKMAAAAQVRQLVPSVA